jgi:hypothetical protein
MLTCPSCSCHFPLAVLQAALIQEWLRINIKRPRSPRAVQSNQQRYTHELQRTTRKQERCPLNALPQGRQHHNSNFDLEKSSPLHWIAMKLLIAFVLSQGNVKTDPASRDFRTLYARWQSGSPGASNIVEGVHGPEVICLLASAYIGIVTPCEKRDQLLSYLMKRPEVRYVQGLNGWPIPQEGGLLQTINATFIPGGSPSKHVCTPFCVWTQSAIADDLQEALNVNTQRSL